MCMLIKICNYRCHILWVSVLTVLVRAVFMVWRGPRVLLGSATHTTACSIRITAVQ